MIGGINKKSLALDKDSIDRELEKMDFLISRGGYIPYVDHLVPPDVSWNNFKYFRNRLNSIIDNTKILS